LSAGCPKTAFLLLLFLLSLAGNAGSAPRSSASDCFTAGGGVEYQVISQRYYESVIDTSTLDPIEFWKSSRDEVNEMILRSFLGYQHRRPQSSLDITATGDLSPSRFLGGGELAWSHGRPDARLALFSRFENRSPIADDDSRFRDGYNQFRTTLSGAQRLSPAVRLTSRVGYEFIAYQSEPSAADSVVFLSYLYDYSLLTGEIGAEFGRRLTARLLYAHRRVPDSAAAGYDGWRGQLEYRRYGPTFSLALTGEIETKDYPRPGGRNDFRAGHLGLSGLKELGREWELSFSARLHEYRYDIPELAMTDYRLGLAAVKLTRPLLGLDLGPIARFEFRDETPVEALSDDYHQWETGLAAGAVGWDDFILEGELTFGARLYRGDGDNLTSYNLVSASLIGVGKVWKNLSATVVFDGLFERHPQDRDDVDYLLSSMGLSVRF